MITVDRVLAYTPVAEALLKEYYSAVGVVARDDAQAMRGLLEDPCSAMWVARRDEEDAGCVVLRARVPTADSGECKRLYVRPGHRRAGVAEMLMDRLESFAASEGLKWVYLDTNDAFLASIQLYKVRGYVACPRYNNNPQATMFLRKSIG